MGGGQRQEDPQSFMDSYSWWIVEVQVQWETSSQNLKCKESGNRERHWASLCPPADAHKHLLFSFSPSSHPRHTHARRNERKGRVLCILPWMLIRNKRIWETGVYLIGLTVAFYSGKAVQRRWGGDPTIPASAPTVCEEEDRQTILQICFSLKNLTFHFPFLLCLLIAGWGNLWHHQRVASKIL